MNLQQLMFHVLNVVIDGNAKTTFGKGCAKFYKKLILYLKLYYKYIMPKLYSLYICLLLFIYNIWKSNYEYINIIFNKLYLLNYTPIIIILNIIGLYLFLKNISFEVNIKYG
jgi:hypothetical protein